MASQDVPLLYPGRRAPTRSRSVSAVDMGVTNVQLPGVIPIPSGNFPKESNTVILHIFFHSTVEANNTLLKGFFFAESVSRYILNTRGQCRQPKSVKDWGYPVIFKPVATIGSTSARVKAMIMRDLWSRKHPENPLDYPVPFSAKISGIVSCLQVRVKGWLHTAEFCLPSGKSVLWPLLQRPHLPEAKLSVWSVLSPFRFKDLVPTFISVLVHHVQHHAQVGFSGTILYGNPYLVSQLSQDSHVLALIDEGRLIIIQWNHFDRYQEVIPNRTYYAVPDQILILNHALLAFSKFQNAVLFMADIDEFLVFQPPMKTIYEFLRTPSCYNEVTQTIKEIKSKRRKNQKKEPQHQEQEWLVKKLRQVPQQQQHQQQHQQQQQLLLQQPQMEKHWAAMNFMRINFMSSLSLRAKNATSDLKVWKNAPRTLDCNPLQTYFKAAEVKPLGSKFLLKANGGMYSWHVHSSFIEVESAEYAAGESCAFVVHIVNLWYARIDPGAFMLRKGRWRRTSLVGDFRNYEQNCLSTTSI